MSNYKLSSADYADQHRQLLFLSMLLLSLIFGIKVGFYFFNEDIEPYFILGAKILALVFFLVLITTIYWKLKYIPSKDRHRLFSSRDSYANEAMSRACKVSWITTLMILLLITSFISKEDSPFPAEFYLNLTICSMLAIFSLSFFIFFRSSGDNKL